MGHPTEQVPQEKHFLMFSPPGSRAMRNLKLGSSVLEWIIVYFPKGSRIRAYRQLAMGSSVLLALA